MIGLDTNVLVRYLAQDDREQSRRATRLIEGTLSAEMPGWISIVVLAELVWVMQACYDATREEIASILERLFRVRQLRIQEADAAWQALRAYRGGKSDFADCLIERVGHGEGCDRTVTFDQLAVRGAGMVLLS
jgi:predicted nucleic-acid-binding protein